MKKESLNFIEREVAEAAERGQQIITRYPPEPNGYMHIGHAKAFWLDYILAKKYGGYTNLRFDDTNPAKEDMEYVDAMQRDMKWLGLEWRQVLFASDYYEQLYSMACDLIKKDLAYVDNQSADEITKNRGSLSTPGANSPYRNRTTKENLELFTKMRDGAFPDGHCVLRAKIDMASGNINMRDPVMYRIDGTEHYRLGKRWVIYPLYDFAHPLSDAMEGISHSICSLEYEDHRPLYDWFIEHAFDKKYLSGTLAPEVIKNYKKPLQLEFSRLNIEQTVMSKRFLKKLVDEGVVDGWDDPRMPTISGMRRRGYPAKAIMDFVASTGVSKTPMSVPLLALEFYVRNHLEPIAPRVSVVCNPIKIVITNYEKGQVEKLNIANHPNNPEMGAHEMYFGREIYIDGGDFMEISPPKYKRLTVGGIVRLRGAYIIKCEKVVYNKDMSISHLECTYYENSKSGEDKSGIKPAGTIHFVEATTATQITVHEYLPLLISGTQLVQENINYNSKIVSGALAEPYIKTVSRKSAFQAVRNGFYVLDKSAGHDKLVLCKTVGLREGN